MRADAASGACRVYTFKEGLLSPVAHDLELRVERFTVDYDAQQVCASFDAGSLRVVHAMRDGQPNPGALSRRDMDKIEQTIAGEILEARRHPEVRFESSRVDGLTVEGTLTIKGHARPLRVTARREGGRLVCEVALNQPEFGIKPYSAMLGTLKIKPDVRVRLEVPDLPAP